MLTNLCLRIYLTSNRNHSEVFKPVKNRDPLVLSTGDVITIHEPFKATQASREGCFRTLRDRFALLVVVE